MRKMIAMVLLISTLLGCCVTLSGCGSSSKDHKYGYYDRSDGKRIWYVK